MFTLKLEISAQLQATLKRWQSAPPAFSAAVYGAAQKLMTAAAARAPRDQGGLVESAYVTPAQSGTERPTVVIGFASQYAAYVHERMDLPHPHGGEPKFLQRALDAGSSQFVADVAATVRQYLERGATPSPTVLFPTHGNAGGRERHSQTSARGALRRRGR